MEIKEQQMESMVGQITVLAQAEYGAYENIKGQKMIDVHSFMPWLAYWADCGLESQVNRFLELLDTMAIANVMLGRLEYPTIVKEGGGMRFAALKVDLIQRLERKSNRQAANSEEKKAQKMLAMLLDKVLESGSY